MCISRSVFVAWTSTIVIHGRGLYDAVSSVGKSGVDPSWYCDDEYYCDDGATCCPKVATSGFLCAGTSQFNTCFMDASSWCEEDRPTICGEICCGLDQLCRDGACVQRAAVGHPGKMGRMSRNFPGLAPRKLGWFPSDWDGMLANVEAKLHERVFPLIAAAWRSGGAIQPSNCWVIGFPSSVSDCSIDDPFEPTCKGTSSATLVQDGEYTFYNNNPTFDEINSHELDWCNDDYNSSQTNTHSYSTTTSDTYSQTITVGVKATVGMSTSTTAGVNIEVLKAEGTFEMHASLETDFSMASTQTHTKTKTWSETTDVEVGPRRHVYSTCAIQAGTFESPFDGRVKINSPVVWLCSEPLKGPDEYIFPTDYSTMWSSAGIETYWKDEFGFAESDLQDVFGQKIGGVFKGVSGQKVTCSTHTVPLKEGESCKSRKEIVV